MNMQARQAQQVANVDMLPFPVTSGFDSIVHFITASFDDLRVKTEQEEWSHYWE